MAKNWYKRKQRNHHLSKNNSTNKGSMSDKNDNKQSNCNRKKATLTNAATSTTIQKDSNCNSSKISETLSTLEMQQINCDKLRDQTRATTTIHSDDNDSNNNNKNNNNNNNGIVGSNDNITNSDDASNTYTDTIMNNDNDESGRKMIVHDNLKEDEETTDDDEGKIDGVVNTTGFYNSQGRKRHSNDQERDDQVSSPLDAHKIADPDYNDIENETKSKSNVDDDNDEDTNDNDEDTNDNASDTNDTGSSNEKKSKKGDNDSARNDKFVCPVCSLKLDSQHSFTVHIRQHNPADHSHTCRLCGKTLSSASSLDRHMLIHSGERPFKCRICNMAFTTNGNMHRHMRTHGMELNQDYHSSDGNNASKYVKSRKRKNSEDTNDNPSHNGMKSPKTKNSESDETSSNYNKIECYCPVCNKPFPSKSALHSHMESHPNDPVCCRDCGMILNNYATYTQHRCSAASSDSTFYNVNKMNFGTPNSVGFYDLSFTDFTSRKFPMIAKSFCEHNFRKASSSYHDFECEKCHRSFPCGSALNLHQSSHNGETYCNLCHCDFPNPATFLSHQIKHRFDLSIFGGQSYSPTHNFMSSQTGLLNGLNSSYGDVPQSEKDDFLALLNLQNRGAQFAIDNNYKFVHQDDIFDNSNYFIHAKPIPSKPTTFHPKIISNTTTDIEGVKPDLADIQSIISVTSSATPLISSIRSSPQAASPASPIQLGISGTKPDSPVPADSANASPNAPALNSCCNNSEVSDEKETSENHCDESKKNVSNVSAEQNQEENSDKETDQTKKFKCSRCVLVFKSANALKRHNRGHIQGGHSYACHLCPYTSLDKSTLVRHLRTHNGERPFQCAICKYAFTTKANCERHVRKRHKKLNKQEIRNAMQYNPNMSSTSSLNNQSTKSEAALSPNSDSFPGGFDTVCKYCNVDFKFNRVLRHHLRSLHNSCSRKPYTCTVCKLGFSTKNNCIRHVVKQHPDMKDKLSTVVLSNANSFTSNSEHSETESFHRESPDLHGIQSNESLNLSNCLSKNDSITSENSQTSQHSSLAALCQIAKNISLPSDKPINLTVGDSNKKSQSNTSVNANFDQPLNLASKSHEEQPLDLAVHALDLSCKNSPSNFSLFRKDKLNSEELKQFSSEAVRNAASSLLALRSMASTGVFSSSGLLANSPLFNPVVSLTSPLPAHSSSMSMLSPISNTSIEDMYKGTSTFRIAKNRLMPKNERSFTCVYCSAGFTLKSNMERHIKRKHPEFARPPRSRGQINANLQEIAQNNSSASLLSKANNSATLSSKTRDALRVVLSNKVLASGSSNKSNSRPGSPYSSNSNQSDLKICDEVSDGNNGDLASVSSLIDHTASSSNALKQYFNNKNNDDGDSNQGELHLQSESFRPNDAIKNDKISKKSKDSNVSTNKTVKKRSAYTDSPNSVSCPYCSRKFPWTSSLRRHILTHTGLKPYKCPKCPILFTTKSNCERHLVRKHNGKDKKPELPVVNPDNKQFKCNICPNSSFTTRGNLRKHHYLRHWTKTGSNLSNTNNNTNTNNNNDKNQVNKNFDIPIGSEDNQSIPINEDESNNFNFKCYICELSFSGRLKCLDHLKSVHSNEYQVLYSKGAVDKMPSPDTKLDLDYQAEQVDGQEKIFCVFCPRQFLLLDNLRRHMRVHLGERPFKCTLCTKKFSLKNSLLRHYRTNHPDAHIPKGKSKLTSSQFNLSKNPESLNLTQSAKSKSSCNSLLYLMPPKDNENPHNDQIEAQTTDTSENDNAEGSDLIQNLLGLQDSKMLDEILNSADSAARILGVKDV